MKIKTVHPLWVFLLLAPFFYGGFMEWVSCLYAIGLIGYLLCCMRKKGLLTVRSNLTLCALGILVLFYGLSGFWAVDHGMALVGFCKFLPLPLFALAVMQMGQEERWRLLEAVPVSGGMMVVLSLGLGQLSPFQGMIFENGRLGGFFQYPNTFAVFLLAGVIFLAGKAHWGRLEFLNLLISVAGIAMTGSRTVFFLLAAVLVIFCLVFKGKKRWVLCLLLAVLVLGSSLYVIVTGNLSTVGRYLTVSFGSSTLLGRLLYYKDALPVILKAPFGLGYLGYFYRQGSFQTGVYSVMHIHNEFLQILLDVGWIPAVLLVIALVSSLVRQRDLIRRMLLAVIVVHCMVDFDLQFISVGFVLLLAVDLERGKLYVYHKKMPWQIVGAVLAGFCLWIGIASGFYQFGYSAAAARLYPGYTQARVSMLPQLDDPEEMEKAADQILSWNQSVSLAYSAMARAAYARGDFANMIIYKQQAITLSKYELAEYLDYFDMLYVGIQLYLKNGDVESAEFCRQRLLEIPELLEQVLAETDGLAWKIRDKPKLRLPEEYQERLRGLGGA